MVWINPTNIAALEARVSDPISEGTKFAGKLVCITPGKVTFTRKCVFEGATTQYPRGRVIWEGTLGPDLGATDAASAENELYISFDVVLLNGTTKVVNKASIDADMNGDGNFDPGTEIRVANAGASWSAVTKLPNTGFAPGVISKLPAQPLAATYQATDLRLEIPALQVNVSIVGIPAVKDGWDVTWLGDQAGYLAGTAFPTWLGNSVLTGHVYSYNGQPGLFVNLSKLKWGDQVVVHAFGQRYIYQVRIIKTVHPMDTSVLGHKDDAWLTLLTCKEFDLATGTYGKRLAVQAILIDIQDE